MKSLCLIVCLSILVAVALAGCGKNANSNDTPGASAPRKVDVTAYGTTKSFEPKGGLVVRSQSGGADDRNGSYQIMLSNTELASAEDFRKPVSSADAVRVLFLVQRKKKTDKTSPAEVETFAVNGSWPHLDDTQIRTFDGSREVESWEHEAPSQDRKGEVKITAVNGEIVTIEADLKFGDKISIKGTFTAKVLPPSP
jgi:hypothetical protein